MQLIWNFVLVFTKVVSHYEYCYIIFFHLMYYRQFSMSVYHINLSLLINGCLPIRYMNLFNQSLPLFFSFLNNASLNISLHTHMRISVRQILTVKFPGQVYIHLKFWQILPNCYLSITHNYHHLCHLQIMCSHECLPCRLLYMMFLKACRKWSSSLHFLHRENQSDWGKSSSF